MATSWTLTAQQVCQDALEHLEVVGAGETMSPDDLSLALRGLDAVLKELPLAGYNWPKLSSEASLAWSALTPQTVSLPADYYAYPVVWKTVSGEQSRLEQIPHSAWIAMADRDSTAEAPTHFYVSQAKVLYFWPVPTVDPTATIQYQKIVDDAVSTTAPDVPQYMLNALGYGVANELKFKYGTNPQKREEIRLTWEQKKAMVLANAIPSEVIEFSVDG